MLHTTSLRETPLQQLHILLTPHFDVIKRRECWRGRAKTYKKHFCYLSYFHATQAAYILRCISLVYSNQ
jgi:hypothetical protein